jgi:hypothetical protein
MTRKERMSSSLSPIDWVLRPEPEPQLIKVLRAFRFIIGTASTHLRLASAV